MDDDNEHGVGEDFGVIVDPFGPEIMVRWGDGITEALSKKHLAVSLQRGDHTGKKRTKKTENVPIQC